MIYNFLVLEVTLRLEISFAEFTSPPTMSAKIFDGHSFVLAIIGFGIVAAGSFDDSFRDVDPRYII